MQTEILVALISALLSLVGALLPLNEVVQRSIRRKLGKEEPPTVESYSKRLSTLMESLTKASAEVDSVLNELAQFAHEREKTIQGLEINLSELESREQQLQKRIQDLQSVPVPVAEHFAALIAQGEKRSAWRDYILFGLGVVVSTVVAILLRLAGLG